MSNKIAVEHSIIKLGEVGILIQMIDETFTGGDCKPLISPRKEQLECAVILLRDTFDTLYGGLQAAYYGGVNS